MTRILLLLGATALLTTCRSGASPRPLLADDHDRLIALMGGLDFDLLEIQRGAADPIEPAYLRQHLAGMREKLERACALRVPHETFRSRAADAIQTIREVERTEWTAANREGAYASLRGLCAGCHRAFAPSVVVESRPPDVMQACGRCHRKIYDEWKGSLHARAWVDPVYLMSSAPGGGPPKLECRACHSMEPILAREISTDVSYRPVYRPYNQTEGITCLACHGRADGTVAARNDFDAPCRPRRDDRLGTPEYCGACHNPSHLAYDEWKLSKSGKTCVDCHATSNGRFCHRMRMSTDPEFVKSALSWACDVADGELRISLTNKSGHKLPSEVPTRLLRVRIRLDGHEEEIVFRRPMKQHVGEKDNRLLPDETRVLTRLIDSARKARVEILFQPTLLTPPIEWILVGRWEREL